jgi:hypothetical protein
MVFLNAVLQTSLGTAGKLNLIVNDELERMEWNQLWSTERCVLSLRKGIPRKITKKLSQHRQ